MCGIVGAVAERNVAAILLEGLKRLEYRGYDSAGIALITAQGIERHREVGKVAALVEAVEKEPIKGPLGIAHTRWATHGVPSVPNAHPHVSHHEVAVVHNGIIENHQALREQLQALGYVFSSQTDTECIVHLVHHALKTHHDLRQAVAHVIPQLEGAYGLVVLSTKQPDRLVAARSGSPLVIGLGLGENFVASDPLALRQVTDRFVYLEEGDLAEITLHDYRIWDAQGHRVTRQQEQVTELAEASDKGAYRHYMLKEIHEQAKVIQQTIDQVGGAQGVAIEVFGPNAAQSLGTVKNIQIVACGTSYHAGLIARYWIEQWLNMPCQVEVASEFRYRKVAIAADTLLVTLSQSGETADTLAALRYAKTLGVVTTLTICNVGSSSLVRESDMRLLTQAGPEIGVASTKAFTTQLVALKALVLALGQLQARIKPEQRRKLWQELKTLPAIITQVLGLNDAIAQLAERFAEKHHALFLGRGALYPVAMEGALKLKEISYIHAEAYPAGELKHGPLALVDADMPVVAVAPNNALLEKLKSNLQEVHARGGRLIVIRGSDVDIGMGDDLADLVLPQVPEWLQPVVYTLPLQLLAYHVAIIKGTDVDQPRNLAKSVTVE